MALPGEPLTKIGQTIQERSPFPHTLVLGYSNGSGVQYVGVPGEKGRGGYEMGEWGLGNDSCGGILIEAAVDGGKPSPQSHYNGTPPAICFHSRWVLPDARS